MAHSCRHPQRQYVITPVAGIALGMHFRAITARQGIVTYAGANAARDDGAKAPQGSGASHDRDVVTADTFLVDAPQLSLATS